MKPAVNLDSHMRIQPARRRVQRSTEGDAVPAVRRRAGAGGTLRKWLELLSSAPRMPTMQANRGWWRVLKPRPPAPVRPTSTAMPFLAERLLGLVLAQERLAETILGDLAEEQERFRRRRGAVAAALWSWHTAVPFAVHLGWRRLTRRAALPHRREPMIDGLLRDFRHGLRALVRQPAFSLIVALTLAVGSPRT